MPSREDYLHLLKLAWPLVLSNSFWNLQMTIDRVILGQFSTDALAASGAVMGVFWAPMALLQQTAAYSTAFVAQFLGAQQKDQIGKTFWHAMALSGVGGILFLGLIALSGPLFQILGHSAGVATLEKEYFDALCWSALPTAWVAAQSGILSGVGQTSTIIWLNGTGFVVNALLDLALVPGRWGFPKLGVAGAGYATAIANAAAAALGMWLLSRNAEARAWGLSGARRWTLDLKFLKNYLKFALPSALQWSLEGLALTAFMVLIGRMPNGEAALAASSLTITIMMLGVLPPFGIAQAASILVGQNIGEGQVDRAPKWVYAGIHISAAYIFAMALSFFLWPEFFLAWFKTDEGPLWLHVEALAPTLLRLMSGFILFDSINLVVTFALKGAGDTAFVSWMALLLPWPLMVLPTAWVMHSPNGPVLAWAAGAMYAAVQATVFWVRFRKGHWKTLSLTQIGK